MQPTTATRYYRFVRYFPRDSPAGDLSWLGPYRWLTAVRAPRMIGEAVALWQAIADGTASDAIDACELKAAVRASPLTSLDPNPLAGTLLAVIARRAHKVLPDTPQCALDWATYGTAAGQPRLGDILCTIDETGANVGLYVGEDATAYHRLGAIAGDRIGVERVAKPSLYAVRRPLYEGAQYAANGIALQADGSRLADGSDF